MLKMAKKKKNQPAPKQNKQPRAIRNASKYI